MNKRLQKVMVGLFSLSLLTGCGKQEVTYAKFKEDVASAPEKTYKTAKVSGKVVTKTSDSDKETVNFNFDFTFAVNADKWLSTGENEGEDTERELEVLGHINVNLKTDLDSYYNSASFKYYVGNGFEIKGTQEVTVLGVSVKTEIDVKYDKYLHLASYKSEYTVKNAEGQNVTTTKTFKVSYKA